MPTLSYKDACLQRWRDRKRRRRAWALKVMAGERDLGQLKEDWQRYDIQAEIRLINQERAEAKRAAEQKRREYEAREKAKEQMHLF